MDIANLNLARKWRSKNFDQVVGQELSVKMLKNSLYLGQLFPVYLFSGQRGCGKTSTARIFAAAVNCEQLSAFQKNPKQSRVPCLHCVSCMAMINGNHPDFFEIDAASHTGVDTIRTIVDSSQLLPVMGVKKVYLIDEAHMLSKASFNALLKILEEPPRSVLFILATTDDQKIIDTVKSRCFQLFFKPIAAEPLFDHLQSICQSEKIITDTQGLRLIIQESDGSARDALNLLEQVRFSSGKVTQEAVLKVLGHVDDATLLGMLSLVLHQKPAVELLHFIQHNALENYSADFIWTRCTELLRAALWTKHGVKPQSFEHLSVHLQRLVNGCSWSVLNSCLDTFYTHEPVFMKTTAKHSLLEMILLQLCQKHKKNDDATGTPMLSQTGSQQEELVDCDAQEDQESDEDEEDEEQEDGLAASWKKFMHAVEGLNNPLLLSVFRQGTISTYDGVAKRLDIEFSKEHAFFKDWLDDSMPHWSPLLKQSFSDDIVLNPLFIGTQATKGQPVHNASAQQKVLSHKETIQNRPEAMDTRSTKTYAYSTQRSLTSTHTRMGKETVIDISDGAMWPKANLLAHYFPGTITEVKEVKA